jgi:hypothetical protein
MDQTTTYILGAFAVSFGLTMLALIDIIQKDFPSLKEKIIWHFIAIVPLIGWLVYLAFGLKRGQKKNLS